MSAHQALDVIGGTWVADILDQLSDGPLRYSELQWVNAGHPRPLLIRDGKVVRTLRGRTTLPVGVGGATPHVSEETLKPADRVLFFTDDINKERLTGGELFGTPRLIGQLERAEAEGGPVQATVARLSHALTAERGGTTSDDATLFRIEWRAEDPDHLAMIDTTISR